MLAISHRMMLPSRQQKEIGTSERPVSQPNTQPMVSPVNASRQPSRTAAHHSGPKRLARPYFVENFHLLSFASLSWRTLLLLSVVGHLPRRRGCIRRTGSAGVGQRSREETAGRTRLGGAARSVYGDLRAAGQLSRVAGAAGWLGSDWRRHRQGGLMATSGRCRRVSQVVPCALDGVAASGIVAAGERRQ